MKKIIVKFFFFLFIASSLAQAGDSFVVRDIRVKGLQKLDVGTIYNYLPLKVGDNASAEDLRFSIQQLFQTGFFNDVKLSKEGQTLVVSIVERPSIASISVSGNSVIKIEDIKRKFEEASLVEGRILNPAVLSKIVKDIEEVYLNLGRYSSRVETDVKDLDRNRVAIFFDISEGKVAKIKKINLVGVEKLNINELKDVMLLKSKRGLRVFSRQDQYSKQKLQADLERITSFYHDHGFNDFKIVSSSVEISPNKQNIFINIAVEEGDIYTAGGYKIEGVSAERAAELTKLITIKVSEPYSQLEANMSRSLIARTLANDGYAFVDVRVTLSTNPDTKVVETLFPITLNKRVYVRRINISGNLLTRDEVIRRELRQFESGWYSAIDIARSESRLKRLGLFETVAIETTPVLGTTDQVDLTITVEELSTGTLNFSLGFSEGSGGQYGIKFSQKNLLGTGKNLSISVSQSKTTDKADISYTNPFYTKAGVSRTFFFKIEKFDAASASTVNYVANTQAVGVLYRIPISETNSLNLGAQYEDLELKTTASTPSDLVKQIQDRPNLKNGILTLGLSKDTRNDAYFPTSGATSVLNVELAVPGSGSTYYKAGLRGSYYQPLGASKKTSLKSAIELGYGDGYDGFGVLPFYKNYYVGGPESVRGFYSNSLGPKDVGQLIGGNKLVQTSVELGFPPFGSAGSRDKQVGLFIDGGMVYAQAERVRLADLRYSAGLFFNWYSNIGPFSMSYGVPLKNLPGDNKQNFQLSLGATF